jgi:hypothetical protein
MNLFKNPFTYAALSLLAVIIIITISTYLDISPLWYLLIIPFAGHTLYFIGKSLYYSWIKNPINAWKSGDKSQGYTVILLLSVIVAIVSLIIILSYV